MRYRRAGWTLTGTLLASLAASPSAGDGRPAAAGRPAETRTGAAARLLVADGAGSGAARVVVEWPSDNVPLAESAPDELLWRFPRPFEPGELLRLPQRLPGWLVDLRYGYDTLLLRFAAGVDVVTTAEGARSELLLTRPPPDTASADASDDAALRLALLDAELWRQRGHLLTARERLATLAARHPQRGEVLAALASAEAALGRWRDAVTLYDRALEAGVPEREVSRARARLLRDNGPELRLATDLSRVRDGDRQLATRLSARGPLAPRLEATATLEERDVDAPLARRADGSLAPLSRRLRRLSLRLALDLEPQHRLAVELLGSPAGAGIAFDYTLQTELGEAGLRLALREPYWNLVEGLADAAWRDRLGLRLRRRLAPDLQLDVEADLNRYGIDGRAGAAHSWSALAGLRWTLAGDAPSLTLGYRVITEHVAGSETRVDAGGQRFRLLPVVSREEHVIDLQWADELTDYLRIDAGGGWIVDRLNSNGPFLELGVDYEPLPDLQMGLRFGRSFTSSRGGDGQLQRAGAFMLLRM